MKRLTTSRWAMVWLVLIGIMAAVYVAAYQINRNEATAAKSAGAPSSVGAAEADHDHAAHTAEAAPQVGSASHDDHDHAAEATPEGGTTGHDDNDHAAAKPVVGDACCPPVAGATGHDENAAHAGEAEDAHDHAAEAAGAHAGEPADAHAGHAHAEGEAHVDEVTLTAGAIAENGIKVAPAQKLELAETLTVPARISYNTEAMAHVGTPVQGRIAEHHVKLGDTVKKGDVLLVIDSAELGQAQSEFLQKRTQAEVARAGLEVLKTAAERARRLHDGKGISLGEFQKREGDYKAALGGLKAAEAAATAAENNLHLWGMDEAAVKRLTAGGEINPKFTVRAPIAGTVVQREATLGEVVGPDREALVVLADLHTLWVLADVPEDKLHRVAPGAAAAITVDAIPGERFSGKVAWIAPELDRATRTAQVRVEITNGNLPLRAGMFAQVALSLGNGAKAAALAVPETAVQEFEGGTAVFVAVAGEPGAFAAKQIKCGPSTGGMVPVLAGLEEGTPVCVEGTFVIKAELAKGIMEGKTCSGHDH